MNDPASSPAPPSASASRPRDWLLATLVVLVVVLHALSAHLPSPYRVSLWTPVFTAWMLSVLRNPAVPVVAPVLLALAAIAAGLGLAGWWPCDLRCQGAGGYQRIAGIPVLLPGALLYAGCALGLAGASRWPRLGRAAGVALWAAAGASGYFLWLSAQLKLDCPLCASVHAAVLAATASRLMSPPRWLVKVAAATVAAALLAAVYTLRPVPPPPLSPASTLPSAIDQGATDRAEHGRRHGRRDAPLVAELAIDLQCAECARQHRDLLAALAPALAAGRVELVIRHLVRGQDSSSAQLAQWAFAAAAAGNHAIFLAGMLGSRENATIAELRQRLDELLDGAAIERGAHADAAVIRRLVDADQRRLRALDADRTTPALVLLERATDSVRQRWQGRFPAAAVAAALEAP